ncbi:hypothetical protein FOMG_17848 [Fusarium oxysporum f. sp. melonis 26406]|uniref:Uncharacterized protein n=1 Tax=Fusarium oxysporum f. sp. melonis 26406 TaxID=1089452 RepID=W9Z107_FUSOX|nr:hypothetical protein FOMG_17848 [Fusarium oxysporum f. sp. melonis 26406]
MKRPHCCKIMKKDLSQKGQRTTGGLSYRSLHAIQSLW